MNLLKEQILRAKELMGIINEQTSPGLTVTDKSEFISCVEEYDVPEIVINLAGQMSNQFMRDMDDAKSFDLENNPEKETMFWGTWIFYFIQKVVADTRTDKKLAEDIRNKEGCIYAKIKQVDDIDPDQTILDWASKL